VALCVAALIAIGGTPAGQVRAEAGNPNTFPAAPALRPARAVIEQTLARRLPRSERPAAAAQTVGPRCDDSQPRGTGKPYDGGSVSALYDQVFHPAGPPIPYLDTYIPQSLLPWDNWDGAGHDLVLLGMYRPGAPSYLVGLDPLTGEAVGTLAVSPSHLGGMVFLGSWMFAGDNPWPHAGSPTVRRYRIEALREAMEQAVEASEPVYVEGEGQPEPIDATDFMTVDGNSLYTGNHGNGGVPGLMYRYLLDQNGRLQRAEGPWRIPLRAQGMVITAQDFLFSTDNGAGARGQLQVMRRAAPDRLDDPIACVWLPAMPEDLALQHGRLMLIFEGGAQRYRRDHPANRIDNVHMGSLGALLALTDPPAPPAAAGPVQAPARGAAPAPMSQRTDPAQAPGSRPTAPQTLNS
jgi:hypothetical protein